MRAIAWGCKRGKNSTVCLFSRAQCCVFWEMNQPQQKRQNTEGDKYLGEFLHFGFRSSVSGGIGTIPAQVPVTVRAQ